MSQGLSRTAGASVAGLAVAVVVATFAVTQLAENSTSSPTVAGSDASSAESEGPTSTVRVPSAPRSFEVQARPARPAGSQLDDARPLSIRLPSGADVPLQPAATSGAGLLQVPDGIRAAGWWDGGSRLGEQYGAMLIAGHVDSTTQGLGPFAELLGAEQGQRIDVAATGDRRQAFVVSGLDVIPASELRNRQDLFSEQGPLRLVLVTCAGPFIPSQGGYQNLAIVTAYPVGAFGAGGR